MPSILLFVLAAAAVRGPGAPAVRFEQRAAFAAIVMAFPGYGDPDPERIPAYLAEMRKQGVLERARGPLFAVLDNSRLMGDRRGSRWALGFRVEGGPPVSPPLERRSFEAAVCAVIVHEGPVETANVAWNAIVPFLETGGWTVTGPPIQSWLGDPSADAPEAQRTEIAIPVRRPGAERKGGRP